MATKKTAAKKTLTKTAPKKAAAKKAATAKPATKPARAKTEGKLSALDAAAKVLAESAEPMGTTQLIETMAAKKLWTSPGGKTPAATLYSAILREINAKGAEARFQKVDRGRFSAKA